MCPGLLVARDELKMVDTCPAPATVGTSALPKAAELQKIGMYPDP